MCLDVAIVHLFVKQFKASVVIADHKEPRLNVIIGQHIILSVLLFLLPRIVFLTVLDVCSLIEANIDLLIAKLAADYIGLDIHIDLIVSIQLKNVDALLVYPEVCAVVELDHCCVGSVSIGDADGQLIRDDCDIGLQASDEGLSGFFNADLVLFDLVLRPFVKLDPL